MARARVDSSVIRFVLDGGALALLEPSHALPLVSLVVALRCGSAVDPPDKVGLARIALRMLRRGCDGMTAEQIDFRIDALGAEMTVDTSPSTVAIHAQVIARNIDPFVELLARLLTAPTFPVDELERLKRETVAEIVEARDSDRIVAHKALQRTLFPGHPYGRNPGGTIPGVESIGPADVLAFYRRFVTQANVVVGIAGDVTAERAPELARKLVAGIGRGEPIDDAVPEPEVRSGRALLLVDKPERTQTQILVGGLGTAPHDEDHAPLVLANGIFGGTFTSRLVTEVRVKRGWSYGTSARVSIDRRRQAWLMGAAPAAGDAGPCLKLMLELMATWVSDGVTPGEVTFIKNYLVRSHAFEVDTATKRLHHALDVELLRLPPDYYSSWTKRVRSVTPKAASAAVKSRIHPGDVTIVVVGTAAEVLEPLKGAVADLREATVVPFDAE
jgi:zinc protease